MPLLPPAFLKKLVARLDDENTLGVMMSGSFARGEGGPYSDIDLVHYVREKPAGESDMPRLEFIDGFLVSITTSLVEKDYAGLRSPRRAIWVIPGLRQAQILLDKDGVLAALKEAAQSVTWESLRAAADAFASRCLAGTAEEVYKILDGLEQSDESKTTYAIWSLTQNLSEAVLVRRGVLVPTENDYIDCAQAAAGRKSAWTRQFRLAIGLDLLPPDTPAYIGFGIAGLRLYRETALLLKDVLQPEDAQVVDRTLAVMTEAGY